ncbi:MAG: hypothetical protein OHK0022_27640 [Roseiflexaceae bacterium]
MIITSYLRVSPAHHQPGYLVIIVGPARQRQQIIETPTDVAAAAALLDLPVETASADVRAACRAAGVRLLGSETQGISGARIAAAADAYQAGVLARLRALVEAGQVVVGTAEPVHGGMRLVDSDLLAALADEVASTLAWISPADLLAEQQPTRIGVVD